MKLEELSVQDFKSYKGKHSFGPFDNFSAIIGENGTGKSNLFDALCFVLGANANVMRCQQLNNLIWNGNPKPNFAKVTLKIRMYDTDKNQIIIKRKIMANGTTQYFINKSKKSASEYRNSLSEFGFPSKLQSYVIFQGDIQQIATMKPIELTSMIEDLSGSIQFKESYEQSESEYLEKQEEVSQLDEKREDLANQRRGMKKEAQETAEWKSLEEKMLKLQQELTDFQIYQSIQNYKISERKLKEIENEIESKKKTISEISEAIESTDRTIETAQQCHKKATKEFRKTEKELNNIQNQLNVLKTKKETIEKEIYNTKSQIKQIKKDISMENQQKVQNQLIISELTDKHRLIEENIEEIKKIEDKYNEMNLNSEQFKLKSEIEELKAKIELEKDNEIRFKHQVEFNEQNLATIEEEFKNIEKVDMPIEPKNRQNEVHKLKKKLSDLKSDFYEVQKSCYRNKKIEKLSNAIHILQQNIPNVYGFVRDLCRPVRSKFELAFSSALTYHLDEVIVKDDETAKKCIEMLKSKGLGQCTFLPLNILTYQSKSNLIDLLEFDERDRIAIEFVTSEIYFCEKPKEALKLYEEGTYKKVVDINGTVYNRKGILTGGSKSKYQNMKQSPDFLKNEIDQIEKQIEQIENEQNDEFELFEKRLKTFNEYKNQIDSIEQNKIEKVNNIMHLNELLRNSKEFIESNENLLKDLNQEFQSKVKIEKDKIKLSKNLMKIFKIKEVDQLIEKFNLYKTDQLTIQNAEQQITFIEDSILPSQLNQSKSKQKELKNQIGQITSEISSIESCMQKVDIELSKQKVEKFANDFQQAKNEKTKLIQMKNQAVKELNKIEGMITDNENILLSTKQDLEYLLTQYHEDFDEILEKDFSSILNENLLQVKSNKQKTQIETSYQQKIDKIKDELNEKQPNFQADQSFNELKEKVHQLDSQLQNKRIEMLEKGQLFRSIKKQRHNMFMKTFDQLVNSIQTIYAKLTRTPKQPLGGNAFLTPISPQCPFLDGITYSVLPPLKRLRAINALSGGEQTLAVISLIFALNEVKPAPCLIFDEIDAALDKRNMAMLSTFLKSESESKQIIIVSHRDRLYSEADSLIGIARDSRNQTSCSFLFKLTEIIENEGNNQNGEYEEPETFMNF